MRRTLLMWVSVVSWLFAGTTTSALAQIQDLTITYVGQSSTEYGFTLLEKPFLKDLTEASGGKIKVDLQAYDLLGLKGPVILRLLQSGTLKWASSGLSVTAGDQPEFEGCDLAGAAMSLQKAYEVCDAYKPVLARVMEKVWNVKLLSIFYNPPQVIWCNTPIQRIADLAGKKIRVSNKTTTDFFEGVRAAGVTIPYADVVPSLQRGVADCAVTGSLNGNRAKWFEVTSHFYNLTVGWAPQYVAVNLDTWRSLNADTQKFLEKQFLELEKRSWNDVTALTVSEGVNCNVGKDPCTLGIKAKMVLVTPSSTDEEERLRILNATVLPRWAKRCGAECAKEWNATAGKAAGLVAPTNF